MQTVEQLYNTANQALINGDLSTAKSNYKEALELAPSQPLILNNYGIVLKEEGDLIAAKRCFKQALAQKQDYTDALVNLANTYREQGQLNLAIENYNLALELNNTNPEIFYNLAITLFEAKKIELAIANLKQALKINPNFIAATANLYHYQMQNFDWDGIDLIKTQLDKHLEECIANNIKPFEAPLSFISRSQDLKLTYEIGRLYCKDYCLQNPSISTCDHVKTKDRIKLAFISNDFYEHPTMHLMQSMFKYFDKSKFKTYIYSYSLSKTNKYIDLLKQYVDNFIDIADLSYEDAARKINQDGIDILIDLKGHTQNSRLQILAFKPAPVQISYLGYPATTGADFIDYMIVDKIICKSCDEQFYTEKLLYMPHSYQVTNDEQEISDKIFTRQKCGLPEDGFVFCSFNQAFKIEPEVFQIWIEILEEVEGSVLWLLTFNNSARDNLLKQVKKNNVNPKRIIFADKLPKAEHLKRVQLADLALDTYTYNGHTTTSDLLYAGVPVLTCKGRHFASCVSASLLSAVGLDYFIATDLANYKFLAIACANRGAKFKSSVQIDRANLFNTEQFVRGFEQLLCSKVVT